MQKIIMLSDCNGCIFTSPVSELVLAALSGKSKVGEIPNLYYLDDAFYLSFRTDFADFQQNSTLVGFIQANLGKTIFVAPFIEGYFPAYLGAFLTFIKLINQGIDQAIAYKQAFGYDITGNA